MPLPKPVKDLRTAILFPCYKRPEYAVRALNALFNAEYVGNVDFYIFLDGVESWDYMRVFRIVAEKQQNDVKGIRYALNVQETNFGLRDIILQFFDETKREEYDFIAKMDNDCLVPKNWFIEMLRVFEESDTDILSPNVYPSNAGIQMGKRDDSKGYWPAKNVGGLWMMKLDVIKDIKFERHLLTGIKGAFPILLQIVNEKSPNIGWVMNVVVDDIGHWSGKHPENIKTTEHEEYYREIGRNVAWVASQEELCQ